MAMNRRSFIGAAAVGAAGLYAEGVPNVFAQDNRLTSIGNTVATKYGRVRGLVLNGVHQFWGIPYGASTAGENRFMPPLEPAAWSGVRDSFQIGNRCPQAPGGEPDPVVLAMNRLETEGEDCLNLNVFTPGTDNGARPVMVWMHGGGFSAASGNLLMYDGTNLAKKEDVVVVAVTHRLNVFGYLHLADIGGEKWAESTNVGSRDLVAALRWVRDNIEAFGGDPGRVTIFGQSGGGGKTSSLMAVPSAEGLFHRAAAQSGSSIRGQAADQATEATNRFLSKLGIGANQLERLQQLTVAQIKEAYFGQPRIPGLAGGPVIDGTFFPRHPWDPTAPGFSADVPLLVGTTATENGWVGPPAYELSDADMLSNFMRITSDDRGKAEGLIELYSRKFPERRNQMLWLTAEADNSRRRNAQTLARLKAEQGSANSYLYLFNWFSPVHDERMGSFHTLEIPFVFYNVDIAASMTGASQYRYQLAHVLSAAWAAFARTGDPNHADMPTWRAFSADSYPTMVFGDEVQAANDPNHDERMALAEFA
jgi:para-nitrobenzyl esterase